MLGKHACAERNLGVVRWIWWRARGEMSKWDKLGPAKRLTNARSSRRADVLQLAELALGDEMQTCVQGKSGQQKALGSRHVCLAPFSVSGKGEA